MAIFHLKKEGKSKYHATKVHYDGHDFDSTYERDRYITLRYLERAGKIRCLRLKTGFRLIPKTTRMVAKQLKTKVKLVERVVELESLYHNDFTYYDTEINAYVTEEFKSRMTASLADYILRRKLMVRKIYAHNERRRECGRRWVFREVVYYNKNKIIITDK